MVYCFYTAVSYLIADRGNSTGNCIVLVIRYGHGNVRSRFVLSCLHHIGIFKFAFNLRCMILNDNASCIEASSHGHACRRISILIGTGDRNRSLKISRNGNRCFAVRNR